MTEMERKFWALFWRVMGTTNEPADYTTDEVEQWDSLRHVELVFELEDQFSVSIAPDEIVSLYSNTGVIIDYLKRSSAS